MSILKAATDKTGNSVDSLRAKITYVQRAEATNLDSIYGAGVSTSNTCNEMILVKEAYDKMDRKGFHHLIFSPEQGKDITEGTFMSMGIHMSEYISRFRGNYQVLMAMHSDGKKDNPRHLHFIVNNVDVLTGARMNLDKKGLYDLKQGLSKIAMAYGIDPIRQYEPVS